MQQYAQAAFPYKCMLQVRTVGGYQLWPRKIWMWLMGGLTLVESILLACWITVHAVMLWDVYTYYTKSYHYGMPPI